MQHSTAYNLKPTTTQTTTPQQLTEQKTPFTQFGTPTAIEASNE